MEIDKETLEEADNMGIDKETLEAAKKDLFRFKLKTRSKTLMSLLLITGVLSLVFTFC